MNLKAVFPSIYDPLTQVITQPSVSDIRRELKIQAILFDYISPSISHLLTSSTTFAALMEEPGLLSEGILRPLIPSGINDVRQYVNWSRLEKDRELFNRMLGVNLNTRSYLALQLNRDKIGKPSILSKGEDPERTYEKRIRFLEENVKEFIWYEQPHATAIAKRALARDLDPRLSPFSGNFKDGAQVKVFKELCMKIIHEEGMLNRTLLIAFLYIKRIPQRRLLASILNANYYSAGMVTMPKEMMLEASSNYVKVYSKKSREFIPKEKEYLLIKKSFGSLLRYLSFDANAIEELSIDSLKNLRKDRSTRRLRRTLQKYVQKWINGNITSSEREAANQEIGFLEAEINEAIRSEVRKQKRLYKQLNKSIKVLERTGFVGSILSLLGLGIIGAIMSAALLIAEPIAMYLKDRYANFIVFTEKLKSEKLKTI